MGDAELVRQAMAGKSAAYEQLVRRYAPRVLAVCHARLGRTDVAEDLAQEALMRGWRAISTLQAPEKFVSWLCGIATRVCLDWLKSAQRTEVPFSALCASDQSHGSAEGAGSQLPASTEAEHRDEIRNLVSEVERLPLEYRQVLMQFYYDDCSYQQIADGLGVSTATVNARLTKARALLRERLSRGSRSRTIVHSASAALLDPGPVGETPPQSP